MTTVHGGDLRAVAARLGRAPGDLLDFSANVNPLGPPPAVRRVLRDFANDPSELARYPDPAYETLLEALAARHAIEPDRIVVANGSAAALGAIVSSARAERCIVAVPAFSEYARALHAANVETIAVPLGPGYAVDVPSLVRAARDVRAALCLLSNPNNPTGALTPRRTMSALAAALREAGCRLVVDEAFVDYVPHESVIADAPDAVVVRSLTKFYAIPGVRIGYAVAPQPLRASIAAALPSWPVGAIEARVARAVLSDPLFDERTRAANAAERERLRASLRALGLIVEPSAANFLFADVAPLRTTAAGVARELAERFGIVVRTCDDYAGLPAPTFVRVAVRSRIDDDRLIAALGALAARV